MDDKETRDQQAGIFLQQATDVDAYAANMSIIFSILL